MEILYLYGNKWKVKGRETDVRQERELGEME
jgi:hypothetical protein